MTDVSGHKCEMKIHPQFNVCKGILYVEETEISDLKEFEDYIKESHPTLTQLTRATFIRTRSPETQVFIAEFAQESLPFSIYIPGERQDTRIFPFRNKPLICRNCHRYNHLKKYCRTSTPICRICGTTEHTAEECQATTPFCVNCEGEHPAGSRDCPVQKSDEEICAIQETQNVNIKRARQIYAKNNEYVEPQKYDSKHPSTLEWMNIRKRKYHHG